MAIPDHGGECMAIVEIFFGLFIFLFFVYIVLEYRNLKIISALKREHHENINIIEEALNKEGINAEDLKFGNI